MKIALCTTCSNRLYQFIQTFDHNNEVVKNNADAEWIIVNYGSKDNLHEFMVDRLPSMSHRVLYANEVSGRDWNLSCAKNAAHLLASGDILVSLDCDNFIGNTLDIVRDKFSVGIELLHLWSGTYGDGTHGRVALTNKLFNNVGGYDESFYPMGYQDTDLFNRAVAFGAKHEKVISNQIYAIKNSKVDSVKHVKSESMTWEDMELKNRLVGIENIKNNKLIANMPHGMAKPIAQIFRGGIA